MGEEDTPARCVVRKLAGSKTGGRGQVHHSEKFWGNANKEPSDLGGFFVTQKNFGGETAIEEGKGRGEKGGLDT